MEDSEGKPPQFDLNKPITKRTLLKGALMGSLGGALAVLGIQKAAEQVPKIKEKLNTEIGRKLDANNIGGQLLPNRQPPKEVQDAFVKKYEEIMRPPTPVPTLVGPKK